MRFYLNKIGGHLQELAVLGMVFVPLDVKLTVREVLVLWASGVVIILAGIEMERRYR